jgi:hypothetical protein
MIRTVLQSFNVNEISLENRMARYILEWTFF